MIFSLTILMIFIFSFISLTISSPFIMNLLSIMMMLMMSIMVSFITYIWVSYSIFIAFLGGMMILFSYTTSMVKSEKTIKPILNFPLIIGVGTTMSILFSVSPSSEETLISKIFLHNMNSAIIFLAMFILLSMIINIKVTEMKKGTVKYF